MLDYPESEYENGSENFPNHDYARKFLALVALKWSCPSNNEVIKSMLEYFKLISINGAGEIEGILFVGG